MKYKSEEAFGTNSGRIWIEDEMAGTISLM